MARRIKEQAMAGRPRSSKADHALREAALAVFGERGFYGMALDEVAKRAKVSRTALYRRWPSRENLLLDALRSWRQAFQDGRDDSSLDLSDLIDLLSRQAGQALGDPLARAILRRLFALPPEETPVLDAYLRDAVARGRRRLTKAILDAQLCGRADPAINAELVQDAVAGALLYKLLSGAADNADFDAADYVRKLFALVLL